MAPAGPICCWGVCSIRRGSCASQDVMGRPLPAILHNAWAAPDGSQAVVLVNATATARAGRLRGRAQR